MSTTTMQLKLNHLCFVLPPEDFDDIEPPDQENHHNPTTEVLEIRKNHTRHECMSHFRAFVKDSLCRLYDLKWINLCHHDTRKSRHRNHSGVFQDMDGIELKDKVGGDNPRIFSFSELYIGSNGFSEEQVLGSGGFGKVYRAVLPSDGTLVAVKCLVERGERFEKTFVAELLAVAHLRHRNLVRLRGWCVHEKQLFLVYDYMPNLSLDRILFRRPENMGSPAAVPLNWERRRNIIGGLAAALYYLHEQLETQIIHRDVKTSNVMLDSHFNARLGDFGLARWLEHEIEYEIKTPSTQNHQFRLAETTKIGGTIGYLPPESFQKRSVATAKSDVFSFGIVVMEVVSGRRAVDLACPDDQIILLDWIRKLSDEGKLLQAGDSRIPDGSYQLVDMEYQLHLALLCTLQNPQLRPNMKWVVEAHSGNIYGKLPGLPSFQCQPLYISLSSASNYSTRYTIASTTATFASSILSNYVTATGETIYATAENGSSRSSEVSSTESFPQKKATFPLVETPREISYMEIISATNNFADSQRVAELDFGTAYQGFLNNGHHVLVKRLGMKTCPALRARFSNELQNLGRLRHRNLVQLRGWCTEQGEMLVVYDYLADRLLSHLLFSKDYRFGNSILQWRHRCNIIKSLASAILYLHEEWDEQVIHRNITSSAVILDPDMNPRLSSFALAEFLTRNDHGHHAVTDTSKSARGIFGYMSPECMESGEVNTMTDIYSFGVVMLEVITGQMAVDFRRPEVLLVRRVHEFEARTKTYKEMADIRLNGVYNQKELMRLFKLGLACTRSNPQSRPSMRQVVRILDGNDNCLAELRRKEESREEWRRVNDSALSLIKRIQALGIQ
ncbi:PREDICTED: receptor like protein kinase S.2-like [Fragaria vesca subsp. vesca]|uniref:receptor like protein kinase S.2-like n=1 Tax=Fragaria vesca subsp. vesca TaxID=101020 RepID=UPI0002C31A65|nr:PREDICTED: receptor like protein kinase S.2-like [Fragaria vesca subsp. vesca]